jgi:hypothetical protein
LTRKIQRQSVYVASTPPTPGPATADTAHTVDSLDWIFGRSLRGYRSAARVCTVPWRAPPPRPCTTRNAISAPMFQASAHSREPSRKRTAPATSTGLRPKVSESLPYTGRVTVTASRYPENSQENTEKPPRSPTICGTAVATMVESRAASAIASIRAATTAPRRSGGVRSAAAAIEGLVSPTPGSFPPAPICRRQLPTPSRSAGRT